MKETQKTIVGIGIGNGTDDKIVGADIPGGTELETINTEEVERFMDSYLPSSIFVEIVE